MRALQFCVNWSGVSGRRAERRANEVETHLNCSEMDSMLLLLLSFFAQFILFYFKLLLMALMLAHAHNHTTASQSARHIQKVIWHSADGTRFGQFRLMAIVVVVLKPCWAENFGWPRIFFLWFLGYASTLSSAHPPYFVRSLAHTHTVWVTHTHMCRA